MTEVMMSMEGSPMFVYGDEIGLGEDLSQHGRNSVRVPMQWSSGRNGGFSAAKKSQLVQDLAPDGPYGYKTLNVDDQRRKADSLLNHVKNLIALRRKQPLIALGRFVRFPSVDPALLVHGFEHAGKVLLFVHNLSGQKVTARIPFQGIGARTLSDLITGGAFVLDEDIKLKIQVRPYGYMWLKSQEG